MQLTRTQEGLSIRYFGKFVQTNVDRIHTHGSSITVGNRGMHQMISPPYESLYTISLLLNIFIISLIIWTTSLFF
jgi:hypothetical protein